ncbi:MAG: cytochrome c biogenesis protein CcdA, partial [Psychrobacter sp.]|nr:cytochrome c biogenesis protein CcdA [Psychrobacter sp.]
SSISNSKAESDKSLNKSAENTATTNKSVVVPPQSASQQNGKDLNAAAKAALAPSNVGNNGESDSLKDPALTNADGLDNAQSAEALQGTIEEGANLDSTDNSTDINVNATNVSDSDVNTTAILGSRAETDKSGIDNQVNNAQMGKSLVATDPFGLATHPWLALGLLFLAGLGLAFTACVYPMIPIVANIVAHQHNPSALKGMLLTAGYALGVASAYGILGAIIAVFGEALGIIGWLQNPIILISFAAVFVLLALYMLEAFTIKLPTRISNKLNHVSQSADSKLGSFGGSVIAGALSALVVSPCVSAPLFGALTAVSTIGNPLLGFAALFMLGFGLSAPLLLLGVTQGNFMPKAGPWMVWVKQGFALLLLAVALLLVERVFMTPMMLIAWAIWFMVIAIWAWSWQGRGGMFTKALSMVAGGWALTLIIGAALGNSDSLQPLASINNQRQDSRLESGLVQDQVQNLPSNVGSGHNKVSTLPMHMTTLTELDGIIKASDNVLVDVTADWCVECRIMDKALFASPPPELSNWQVVKLDITETTPDSKAILARYRLFGPPALLYYQQGELVGQQVGEIKRADFVQTLTQLQ